MNESDQRLVENITYLASLASSREEIDADLDTLRLITSKYQPGRSFSASEVSSLQTLHTRLKHHLIHEDPVCAFTKESLEQKVAQHLKGVQHFYQYPIWSLILIVAAAAALSALPFAIPNNLGKDIKIQLGMSLFFFGTHCGNIWFFMAALQNFRKELRVAFGFLAAGVLIVGIVGAQFTLINLFGFSDLPWAKYGGFLFLFPIAYIPLLVGTYLFAKQLSVTSWPMSLRALGAICASVTLLLILMPNKAAASENIYFIASALGISLGSILIGWTAAIAYAGAQQLTTQYARGMKLLASAFAIICASGIALVSNLIGLGHLTALAMSASLSPVLIAEPLELLAGFIFKKRSSE
jgi:hypothetical protein